MHGFWAPLHPSDTVVKRNGKRKKNGDFNQFYENMRLADSGDIVFSYYTSRIQKLASFYERRLQAESQQNLEQLVQIGATKVGSYQSNGTMFRRSFGRVRYSRSCCQYYPISIRLLIPRLAMGSRPYISPLFLMRWHPFF